MNKLSIDIETYSSADLSKTGVYRYCESPDFKILLFGYAADDGEVSVVDIAAGERVPEEIIEAIKDPECIKWAFNSSFERICLSKFLGLKNGEYLPPESWRCSMVWCAYIGLPLSLADAGAVMGLDKQKLEEGRELIKFFSCRNVRGKQNLPADAPTKWEMFKKYNRRDVEAEMAVEKKLRNFPVPESVWEEYHIDQHINDCGVAIDLALVDKAIEMEAQSRCALSERMQQLTCVENPNSVKQIKNYLSENGIAADSLSKKAVAELIKTASGDVREVLTLRSQLAKSSVKKYETMRSVCCEDGRARGTFRFYGANRTGRWSGRLIQLQNLPQNHIEDLEGARSLVKTGDYSSLKNFYDDVPDILSQLIRTAFVAEPGKRFIVADYSAIEARISAYMAQEKWRIRAFDEGVDIYCASASTMFHVPVEKHGANSHLRQKGKIAELALGYGGSVGALKAMGAIEMGLKEEELLPLVDAWRKANPAIVKFWQDADRAAAKAVTVKKAVKTHGVIFECAHGVLSITLPSGRQLNYLNPKIGKNKFGSQCICYEGMSTAKKWERLETYGPKLVENIVQGTARDVLAYAMKNLKGEQIVMHIHDELVIEASSELTLERVCSIMAESPPWMPELILRADGYETPFYKKD